MQEDYVFRRKESKLNCKYCADGIGGGIKDMKFHLTYCEWNPKNRGQAGNKFNGFGIFRRLFE